MTHAVLAWLFGIDDHTVRRYLKAMVGLFTQVVVPKALHFRSKEYLELHTPPAFAEHFPSVVCIVDGLPLKQLAPENPLLQRVTWSTYKHCNLAHTVVGKYHPTLPPTYNPRTRSSTARNTRHRRITRRIDPFPHCTPWRPQRGGHDDAEQERPGAGVGG